MKGMIDALKGWTRMNVSLIVGSIDCSEGYVRQVSVVEIEKELGIEIEEFVVRNKEVIKCVL